jgi:hypothetical protein
MKYTDAERLSLILDHSKLKNKTIFARKLGYKSSAGLYPIFNGQNCISNRLSRKIINVYPEISHIWILTGEGSFLIKEEEERLIDQLYKQIADLKALVKKQKTALDQMNFVSVG